MAYQLGLRHLPEKCDVKVDKVFALSGFINENSIVYEYLEGKNEEQQGSVSSPDVFIYHGNYDGLVPEAWGKTTYRQLFYAKLQQVHFQDSSVV